MLLNEVFNMVSDTASSAKNFRADHILITLNHRPRLGGSMLLMCRPV